MRVTGAAGLPHRATRRTCSALTTSGRAGSPTRALDLAPTVAGSSPYPAHERVSRPRSIRSHVHPDAGRPSCPCSRIPMGAESGRGATAPLSVIKIGDLVLLDPAAYRRAAAFIAAAARPTIPASALLVGRLGRARHHRCARAPRREDISRQPGSRHARPAVVHGRVPIWWRILALHLQSLACRRPRVTRIRRASSSPTARARSRGAWIRALRLRARSPAHDVVVAPGIPRARHADSTGVARPRRDRI